MRTLKPPPEALGQHKATLSAIFSEPRKPRLAKEDIHAHCARCAQSRKRIRGTEVLLICLRYGICTPGCIDRREPDAKKT